MELSLGPTLRDSANTVDGSAGDERMLFGGAYAGRRVLVTGHTGFKGSWLALWLRRLGADVRGLALPADGELMAFPHTGFWQPMDTLREKNLLEELWQSGRAPWKRW